MKKSIKTFIYIFLITLLFFPKIVMADNDQSTKEYKDTSNIGKNSNSGNSSFNIKNYLDLNKYKMYGDASSRKTEEKIISGPTRCGVEFPCFNGTGLFIYLIKYDPDTKTETIAARPVLIYSGDFLKDTKVQEQEAKVTERAKNSEECGELNSDTCTRECSIEYKFQTVVEYPKDSISYEFAYTDSNGKKVTFTGKPTIYSSKEVMVWDGTKEKKVKKDFGTIPIGYSIKSNTENKEYDDKIDYVTVGTYVNDILPKIISNSDHRWTYIEKFFSNNNETFTIDQKNYDKYYLAFEIAKREPSGSGKIEGYINKAGGTEDPKPIETKTESEGDGVSFTYTCNAGTASENTKTISEYLGASVGEDGSNVPLLGACTAKDKTYDCSNSTRYRTQDEINTCENDCKANCNKKPNNGAKYSNAIFSRIVEDGGGSSKDCKCETTCNEKVKCTAEDRKDSSKECSPCISNDDGKDAGWTYTGCTGEYVSIEKKLYQKVFKNQASYVTNARNTNSVKYRLMLYTAASDSNKRLVLHKCSAEDIKNGRNECDKQYNTNYGVKEYGHYIKLDDKTKNVELENYIGPTLKDSLVGTNSKYRSNKNTKYELVVDSETPTLTEKNFTEMSSKYTWGVSLWWIEGYVIPPSCTDIDNCGSNPSLKCAENFCDNKYGYDEQANTYLEKNNCIINECKVKITPDNCSNNTTIIKDYNKAKDDYQKNASSTSTCNISDSTGTKMGNKKNDKANFWCYSEDPEKNPDQRTFVNVACMEYSGFDFYNINSRELTPGVGIEYYANLHGRKECTVWFDLESWKLAYASYHSKDVVCSDGKATCSADKLVSSRFLLMKTLELYNANAKGNANSYTGDIGRSIASIIDESKEGGTTVQWQTLPYSVNKDRFDVQVKIKEELYNISVKAEGYSDIEKLEPISPALVNSNITYKQNVNKAEAYDRLESKPVKANTYKVESSTKINFELAKYCFSNDGKKTIVTKSNGEKCEHKYYTSLSNQKNPYYLAIDSTLATIKADDYNGQIGDAYYINEEKCERSVVKSTPIPNFDPYICSIKYTALEATTVLVGIRHFNGKNNTITSGASVGVIAEVSWAINLSDGDKVNKVILTIDDDEYSLNPAIPTQEITLPNGNNYKSYALKCRVETEKEKIATGYSTVIISKCYTDDSGVCKISKTEKNGDNRNYYISGEDGEDFKYVITDTNQSAVEMAKKDGFYLLTTTKEADTIIVANNIKEDTETHINHLSGKCCIPKISEIHRNCEEENKNKEWSTEKVREYCGKKITVNGTDKYSWEIDVNKYDSEDDCVNKCREEITAFPNCSKNAILIAKSECSNNHEKDTVEYENCVNYAASIYCSGPILFRPISIYDPFPDSYNSPSVITGKRVVGANWQEKEKYITEEDTNYSGTQYVIDLSPEDIRAIRDDTTKTKQNEKEDPNVTVYCSKDGKKLKGKDCEGYNGYESSFLHEDFNYLFKDVGGATVPEQK